MQQAQRNIWANKQQMHTFNTILDAISRRSLVRVEKKVGDTIHRSRTDPSTTRPKREN